MDLSKLIKDIATNAQQDRPTDEPASERRRVIAPEAEPEPKADPTGGLRFTQLEELATLDSPAAAKVLDTAQPDDVVITIAANPDEALRRWLLAPLDQESRHWVVDNAMQLGEPTAKLARDAAERLIAVANRLVAEGAITEADRGPQAPPARAQTDPDHLSPPRGVPTIKPERPALHVTPTVGFAVGGNPATTHTVIDDTAPGPAAGPVAADTGAQAAELSDLRRQLAHLIALAQRHGQESVAALADEAPHPLLQAGLHLLADPIPRSQLDEVLLDLQHQLERAYAAQCDLVRHAITAIHEGTKPEDFLAGE